MKLDLSTDVLDGLARLAKDSGRTIDQEAELALHWWLLCLPSNREAASVLIEKEETHVRVPATCE